MTSVEMFHAPIGASHMYSRGIIFCDFLWPFIRFSLLKSAELFQELYQRSIGEGIKD